MATGILQIANYLIVKSKYVVTNLKLNKLLYYVYGVNLVVNPGETIDESPQAWKYGPVFPTVYHGFKEFGAGSITNVKLGVEDIKSPDVKLAADKVFEHYFGMESYQLVNLTHKQGSPWVQTYRPWKRHAVIDDGIIRQYFAENIVDRKDEQSTS